MFPVFFMISVVGALSPTASAQPPAPRYKIESIDFQVIIASITYEVQTTQFAVSRWMVFLPEPPTLPSQTITRITAKPKGRVIAEKGPQGRKVRFIDQMVRDPLPGGRLSLRLEVEATLRRRELVPLGPEEAPPKVAPLSAAELKYYTSATPQVDLDSRAFRDWLEARELRARKGDQTLELAERTLKVFREELTYHYDPRNEKLASFVCTKKVGDCASLTNLLIAVMRANKIPARALVGRLAKPRLAGSRFGEIGHDNPHVRAEVFVAGIGWVPIDPSEALMGKSRPVAYFIGKDPGDLLVLHVGGDLKLPFPDKERTADMLQVTPFFWAIGTGPFDAALVSSSWDVKANPVRKR